MSVTGRRGVGIPIILLHDAEGAVVTIELKDGSTYRGTLEDAQDNMNCLLKVRCPFPSFGRVYSSLSFFISLSVARSLALRLCTLSPLSPSLTLSPSQDVTRTSSDGVESKLEMAYVRGSQVGFIVLPEMLKYAPFFNRIKLFRKHKGHAMMGAGGGGGSARPGANSAAILQKSAQRRAHVERTTSTTGGRSGATAAGPGFAAPTVAPSAQPFFAPPPLYGQPMTQQQQQQQQYPPPQMHMMYGSAGYGYGLPPPPGAAGYRPPE